MRALFLVAMTVLQVSCSQSVGGGREYPPAIAKAYPREVSALGEQGAAPPARGVRVSRVADLDACSVGKVSGLREGGDGFLAVREGPGTHFKEIDRLRNGWIVFLCDSSDGGDWDGIIYPSDSGAEQDCGLDGATDRDTSYAGQCKSGWVRSKWVELVAG